MIGAKHSWAKLRRSAQRAMMIASFIAFAGALLYVGMTVENRVPDLSGGSVQVCNEGWRVSGAQEDADLTDLAKLGYARGQNLIELERDLPENGDFGDGLLFCTCNERVTVTLDGSEIYCYGEFDGGRLGNSFGQMWNLVSLPEGTAGGKLVVKLERLKDWCGSSSLTVYTGHPDTLIHWLYLQKTPKMIAIAIMAVVALVFLIYAALQSRWNYFMSRSLMWLGLFVLLVDIWCVTDDSVGQLIGIPKAVNYVACCSTFMLLSVPLLQFTRELFPRYGRVFQWITSLTLLNYLVRLALFMGLGVSMDWLLPITHALHVISMVLVAGICIREWRNKSSRILMIGILMIIAVYAVIMPLIYIQTSGIGRGIGYNAIAFAGLSMFVLFMCFGLEANAQVIYRKAVLSDKLAAYAYTDLMTGVGNRAACDARIKQLESEVHTSVTIFMTDMNNLKETNDAFGHDMGDRMLQDFAICIKEAFSKIGEVYRVGGDEFIVLVVDCSDARIKEAVHQFWEMMQIHNQHSVHPIEVAIGSARREEEKGCTGSLGELRESADRAMYRNKASLKRGEQPNHWIYQ